MSDLRDYFFAHRFVFSAIVAVLWKRTFIKKCEWLICPSTQRQEVVVTIVSGHIMVSSFPDEQCRVIKEDQ